MWTRVLSISLVLLASVGAWTQVGFLKWFLNPNTLTQLNVPAVNSSFDGIVYILPSRNSTPYWATVYGDRVFFYVYANLTAYESSISADFKTIRDAGYSFVVVVIPLADNSSSYPNYYRNLNIVNRLAYLYHLEVMWAIFPKWQFGPEWDYLHPNTTVHAKLTELLDYLVSLNDTYKVAVWYGWAPPPRGPPLSYWCNTSVFSPYFDSLPSQVKAKYAVWIDMPYDSYVNACSVGELLKGLDVPVVTEEYTLPAINSWYDWLQNQYLTTGVWNASSVTAYCTGVRWLLAPMLERGGYGMRPLPAGYEPRVLIVWIYWDVNDGSGELYRALTETGLANPLKCSATVSSSSLQVTIPIIIAIIIVVAVVIYLILTRRR